MSNIPITLNQFSPEDKRALLTELLQKRVKQETLSYPLSYGQQALWFLYQQNRSSSAYNVSIPARILSRVDTTALKTAFQGLSERHPTLRTTFQVHDNGQPVQVVHNNRPVQFTQVDASTWSQDDLDRAVRDTHQQPFDLEQGPIFRVTLFTRTLQEHVLLLSLHHIVYDAWSIGPLLNDAQQLYTAAITDQAATLAPLPQQYSDYIQWQTQALSGPDGERLWHYWQTQLAGDLPTLDLPTDHPRPRQPSYRGASHHFTATPDQTEAIKALAQAEGTTVYTVLMTAFQILLHRYTGQTDILVGSPMGGRPQTEFENIIGYFVNPVAIRGRLTDNISFQDFLNQIRTTVLDAIDHQDYPFPLLVERLQPTRESSRSPIFQVLFNFLKLQKIDAVSRLLVPSDTPTQVKWSNLDFESYGLEQQEGQFDLTLEMFETDDTLMGAFKYSTDLFNADTIERMAGHFQSLLMGIIHQPSQPISHLPLRTAAEHNQLRVIWNTAQADYPQQTCIHQLFEQQVERTPEQVAVVFETEQLTYRELNQRANQLARHLQALGVGPEVMVGICVERSLDMVIGVLAILKAGGGYVPLDPAFPQDRLTFMAEDAQIAILLTQTHLTFQLSNVKTICLDSDWASLCGSNQDEPFVASDVTSEHLAYLIYTSGSTGKPKGVQITHDNAVNLLTSVKHQPGLTADDTLLAVATLSFDISVSEIFLPLMVGAKLVIASQEVTADGFQLIQAIDTYQPTFMQPTPATWRMLLAAGWTGQPNLTMISTGEPLPKDLAEQLLPLGKALWNLYGPTETTIWASGYQVKADNQPITIGYPIANTQLHILDNHMQPVPIGIPGELFIGGTGIARGYLNRPELNAEQFIVNPLRGTPSDRLYRTGDLARWLPNGQVECLGRLDYQVKIRGFRIELEAIESAIANQPQVQETVVMAREDEPGNKRLVAYVVTPSFLSARDLRHRLKEKLPDYMVPSSFVFLDAFPITPNGKINRRALPAPDPSQRTIDTEFVAPRNPTEEMLSNLWCELLKLEQVGIYDNFFEMGGHSLLATQVISRIRNQFDLELSLQTLFESPTVAELCDRIETIRWATQSSQSTDPDILNAYEEGAL